MAILAPERAGLSYAELKARLDETVGQLNSLGVGRGDRVITLFPFGPDGAVLNLAIASCATVFPIDPTLRDREVQHLLQSSGAVAMVIPAGLECASVTAARQHGLTVIELSTERGSECGVFRLHGPKGIRAHSTGLAEPGDVAVILATSGTTSRPKLVPLTHCNLHACLGYFTRALEMSPADRCLNIMPMFHALGLLNAVFVAVHSGGSVICAPHTATSQVFRWIGEYAATWYNAVPAVHQSILETAPSDAGATARRYLRFVRTSSSQITPELAARIEQTMGVPLVHVYGMTEAPVSVYLVPGPNRPQGSVGRSGGCDIGIADDRGNLLPAGVAGEVVIRGPHVMSGYWRDPQANKQAFFGDWLRSGDLGYLDDEGYLFLRGRIKEMINRGGEKVAPIEIDEAINQHPGIRDGACYAVPDPRLGEEIAAVVELKDGVKLTTTQIQEFLATRLSAHKVPRHISIVPVIPRNESGKLNRRRLAIDFPVIGIEGCDGAVGGMCGCQPSNSAQWSLLAEWKRVLNKANLGIHSDFFKCGGDSLLGTRLLMAIENRFGITELMASTLLQAPTVEKMANWLAVNGNRKRDWTHGRPDVKVPIFTVSGGFEFRAINESLPKDQPLYNLPAPSLRTIPLPYTIEKIAASCIEDLRSDFPHGPYVLGGWCLSGVIAWEMARQLNAQGETVAELFLFDLPDIAPQLSAARAKAHAGRLCAKVRYHAKSLLSMPWQARGSYILGRLETIRLNLRRRIWSVPYRMCAKFGAQMPGWLFEETPALARALRDYVPQPYSGSAIFFWPQMRPFMDKHKAWESLVGSSKSVEVPGTHISMFEAGNAGVMAWQIADRLEQIHRAAVPSAEPKSAVRSTMQTA